MKNTRRILLLAVIILFTTMAKAQDINGAWKGVLAVQGMEMELIYHLSTETGELTATMDVPLQGATGIPMEGATFMDNTLTITMAAMQMKYVAKLNGEKFEGTYTQAGQEMPLVLERTVITIPGNTKLPSTDEELAALAAKETGVFKYSVEDFFTTPAAFRFRLSPEGSKMAYLKRTDEGKKNLWVKDTKSGDEKMILEEGEDLIRTFFWANDDRILYLQDKGGNENHHVFGVDIDGSNKKELTPFEGVKVGISAVLRDDKDHVIISMNKDNPQLEQPYKLNINTGEIEKLYESKEGDAVIVGYDFDKDGNLRGITSLLESGVDMELKYKIDGEFKSIKTIPMGDSFSIISFNYQSDNPDDAYVLSNLESDKSNIYLYDLKKNKVIKEIFAHDEFDASSIGVSKKRNYELDYYYYEGEKMVMIPVSKTYKALVDRFKKEFGGKEFFVTGKSKDENTYLLVVTGDKLVADYYTYDVKSDKITLLYKLLPQLEEKDMAAMTPIKFKSRDGLTIHGYITMPNGVKKGEKIPLIVNPHGGPQGVRDSWGFNPEVQLFASRGYAVLQVNFRISGGFGKSFMKAGFKQIGRKAMDDVEDGIAYALENYPIAKDKIAIYGASHGGYAVLRGMTKTPKLYACGVDYVGVSNLNTFMKTIPAYWEKYLDFLYATWYDPTVPEEQAIMNEISPALHTDLIVKPLFVVQGANDPRVNIDEADQIVEKLRARGVNVPYMVKYDEGHGFGKEENRIDFYKAMMGFFAENLK